MSTCPPHLDAVPLAPRWAPRQHPSVLVWVLLAHVLLWLGWSAGLGPHLTGRQSPQPQPQLLWLQWPTSPQPQVAVASRPSPQPRPTRPAAPRPAAPYTQPEPAPRAAPPAAPVAAPADTLNAIHIPAAAPAAPAAPAASAASAPRERLMDSLATQAAIRQAARGTLLSERAAQAMDQPLVSRGEKEAQAVNRAAKGDCAKGEFGGAGMGLLSLPFLVVAEVRGQCAR